MSEVGVCVCMHARTCVPVPVCAHVCVCVHVCVWLCFETRSHCVSLAVVDLTV